MSYVRDLVRVVYWSLSIVAVTLWVLTIAFLTVGVMGEHDLTFLTVMSLVLAALGYAGRRIEALSFLWHRG